MLISKIKESIASCFKEELEEHFQIEPEIFGDNK